MNKNVVSDIVSQNMCIGCGTCVAVCPVSALSIAFSESRLYQPREQARCLAECSLCLGVCPFVQSNPKDVDLEKTIFSHMFNIKYHDHLGFYLSTYEMHKEDEAERLKSASGGVGHWLLSQLLKDGHVDRVITVTSNVDSKKLFKFEVLERYEFLKGTQGSVYYPTELSEVLHYVIHNEGRYVITALPCYAKSLRLAQQKKSILNQRIKFIVGLVCGQMKTKVFTQELGLIAVESDTLSKVRYRVKIPGNSANNFAFEFNSAEGAQGYLEWSAEPRKYWSSRMFTPMACNYCTDTFARCADVVLMDAWLPEYAHDYRGNSLVIVRSHELEDILTSSKQLSVRALSPLRLLASQRSVVKNKHFFAYGSGNLIVKVIIALKKKVQKISHHTDWKSRQGSINFYLQVIRILEATYRWIMLPARAWLKLTRRFNGEG